MEIMETATFWFRFKEITSKEDSYRKLQKFLADNDWLDESGNKKPPLDDYHTEKNGTCEIILAEDKTSEKLIDLIEELFDSLRAQEDILWIKTIFNNNTENIVYNNIDIYPKHQEKDISEIVKGDMVLVHKK